MQFSIQIIETDKQISQKMIKALIPEADKFMRKCSQQTQKQLPGILRQAIMSSPTYAELIGGKLRYELGIPDPIPKLEGLITIWTDNIDVNYVKPTMIGSDKIFAFFSVSLVRSDYTDVLGSNYALVYDQKGGYNLPWLQWLLFNGTQPIISTAKVKFGKGGRTGGAIMVSGGSWSVPLAHAGSQEDNWITRAIDQASPEIENFLKGIFK